MHALPDVYGMVKLVQWEVFSGRDFTDRAVPPNRGHRALRWPVDDLDGVLERTNHAQGKRVEAHVVDLAPFGRVRLAGVSTPDGALMELLEPQ